MVSSYIPLRDARVYDHTTTAMNKIEYTPPAPSPPPSTMRHDIAYNLSPPVPFSSSSSSYPLKSQGLCITCSEIQEFVFFDTGSPTPSPLFLASEFPETPAPVLVTEATETPFGIFPETPAPTAGTDGTPAPTIDPNNSGDGLGAGDGLGDDDECPCVASLSETEAEVLAIRGKAMVCDPTCSDGSDLTWGESVFGVVIRVAGRVGGGGVGGIPDFSAGSWDEVLFTSLNP